MEDKKEFIFEIDDPKSKFEKHLSLPKNDRIIVSAPFGAGKTYFLKEFFKNNSKYEVIHLFPVNYSVASNEDIFELLKYDILFELLGKDVEFETLMFSQMDFLPFYLKNNIKEVLDVFRPFLTHVPVIGKSLGGVSEKMKSLFENFSQKAKDIQIDEHASVTAYLESFTKQVGSIYEEDFYSQLILQLVNQLKSLQSDTKESKETILIIDDLDRIDPDHVFRILNVLSAQIDRPGLDNKFGFDKIILVFDQYNVRNIFENRYGANVDYTGYIDKFYSTKIFEYENFVGLKAELKRLLGAIKLDNYPLDLSKESSSIDFMIFIFERLIELNALSTRRLLKILNSNYEFSNNKIIFPELGNHYQHKSQFFILIFSEILLNIFEGWEELIKSTQKLKEIKLEDYTDLTTINELIFMFCLPVLDVVNHKLETTGDSHHFPSKDKTVVLYEIERDNYDYYAVLKQPWKLGEKGFIQVFLDTLEYIRNNSLLKL